MRILMIDNYDSFTFNLVQYMQVLGADVLTYRNDALTPDQARDLAPDRLVISPGPGTPSGAGNTKQLIEALAGAVPILGVCLGHQAIAEVFGAPVRHAKRLMHGKPSPITHDGKGVYANLPSPTDVGRYHSLTVFEEDLPSALIPTSHTPEGELMGMRHADLPIEGVQFHPESVLTPLGFEMIANFMDVDARNFPKPMLGEEAVA